MGEFGGEGPVERLIRHAGALTVDEAADIYYARAARLLLEGPAGTRQALLDARRTAARTKRLAQYENGRRAAVTAWRSALPEVQGPWLMVGAAIANAAGALVLEDVLERKTFLSLVGPWQQAIGTLTPVGPGHRSGDRFQPVAHPLIR